MHGRLLGKLSGFGPKPDKLGFGFFGHCLSCLRHFCLVAALPVPSAKPDNQTKSAVVFSITVVVGNQTARQRAYPAVCCLVHF
jgi:hypothetical protein